MISKIEKDVPNIKKAMSKWKIHIYNVIWRCFNKRNSKICEWDYETQEVKYYINWLLNMSLNVFSICKFVGQKLKRCHNEEFLWRYLWICMQIKVSYLYNTWCTYVDCFCHWVALDCWIKEFEFEFEFEYTRIRPRIPSRDPTCHSLSVPARRDAALGPPLYGSHVFRDVYHLGWQWPITVGCGLVVRGWLPV